MTNKKQQEENAKQPLIVKKIKKGDGGHHGGAWKVAYADFVTAMMAFFLLLWLLAATTDAQKEGISSYFDPTAPKVSQSVSGAGGVLGGIAITKDGEMIRDAEQETPTDFAPIFKDPEELQKRQEVLSDVSEATDSALEREQKRREEQQFEQLKKRLEQAINSEPDLKKLVKNLKIDITDEGLRIQIVDQQGEPMFPTGSANMFDKTSKLMALVAKTIEDIPNSISIRGHTDGRPYRGSGDYSNWELSADRANASRRVLLDEGYPANKIANVVGKADTDHFIKDNPLDPQNRRISIILLRESASNDGAGVNSNNKADAPRTYERSRGNIQFP